MDESEFVKIHSCRFFEYYYEELDRHNIQYEPGPAHMHNSLGDIPEDAAHSPTSIFSNNTRMSPQSDPMATMRADRVRQAANMVSGGFRPVKTDSIRLMKRIYDNFLLSRLDNQTEGPDNMVLMPLVGFIKQQFDFLVNIIETDADHFQLFNISTINILFSMIVKLRLNLVLYENYMESLLANISRRNLKLKTALLDNLIFGIYMSFEEISRLGYLDNWLELGNYTKHFDMQGKEVPRNDKLALLHSLMTPKTASQRLDTLNTIAKWVYTNYWTQFWMTDEIYVYTQELINKYRRWLDEPNVFLMTNTLCIQARIAAENISPLFIKQLNALKNAVIGPNGAKWIHRTLDKYRATISWILPNMRKSQIIIIDGRNWFYAEEGLNIPAVQSYLTAESNQELANLLRTHTKQMGLMFDLSLLYPRNILVVFNEKHADIIHRANPVLAEQCIYTPRGVNDDLFILYMWLSNPGSFVLSNDHYSDHGSRVTGNKYLEGLWAQWIMRYKISRL